MLSSDVIMGLACLPVIVTNSFLVAVNIINVVTTSQNNLRVCRMCQKNLDVTCVAYVLVDAFSRDFSKVPAARTVSRPQLIT